MSLPSVNEVTDRHALVGFVAALRADYLSEHGGQWANDTVEGFLEAIEAWLSDADGLRENVGIDVDKLSPWELAAAVLLARKIYE